MSEVYQTPARVCQARLARRHPCLREREARKNYYLVELSSVDAAEAAALQAGMPELQSHIPIRRVKYSLFIDPLIRMRAEEVALGLDQIRRESRRSVGLQVVQ
jgi:hypothetical protein